MAKKGLVLPLRTRRRWWSCFAWLRDLEAEHSWSKELRDLVCWRKEMMRFGGRGTMASLGTICLL